MLIFVKPKAVSKHVWVAYVRGDRFADAEKRLQTIEFPTDLQLDANLYKLGPASRDEFHLAFHYEAARKNWYKQNDRLRGFWHWAEENVDAGPVEFRRKLRSLEKAKDHSDAVEGLVASGGTQRMVCSVFARQDLADPCPGCQDYISQGEWYNGVLWENEEVFFHSMCAPKDKIIVGDILDADEELIKHVLLPEQPDTTYRFETIESED